MSLSILLKHKLVVVRLMPTNVDGAATYTWVPQGVTERCFLDLNYSRGPQDSPWVKEAGRVADRTGVLFLTPKSVVKPADHVVVTARDGIRLGEFEVQGTYDLVTGNTGRVHHVEVGVHEVATPLGRA